MAMPLRLGGRVVAAEALLEMGTHHSGDLTFHLHGGAMKLHQFRCNRVHEGAAVVDENQAFSIEGGHAFCGDGFCSG